MTARCSRSTNTGGVVEHHDPVTTDAIACECSQHIEVAVQLLFSRCANELVALRGVATYLFANDSQ